MKKKRRYSPNSDYQLNTVDLLDWLLRKKSRKHPTNSYNLGESKLPKQKHQTLVSFHIFSMVSHLAIPHTLPSERQKGSFFSAWVGAMGVQPDVGMEVKIHSGSQ